MIHCSCDFTIFNRETCLQIKPPKELAQRIEDHCMKHYIQCRKRQKEEQYTEVVLQIKKFLEQHSDILLEDL